MKSILLFVLLLEFTHAKKTQIRFELVYGPLVTHQEGSQKQRVSSTLIFDNGKCQLMPGMGVKNQTVSELVDEKTCSVIYQSLAKSWPLEKNKKFIRWPELAPHAPHVQLTRIDGQGIKSQLYIPLLSTRLCTGKRKCKENINSGPIETAAKHWMSALSVSSDQQKGRPE